MNKEVDDILNYNKEKDDYYLLLGCDDSATCYHFETSNVNKKEDQINAEYRVRALQCHPDKNEGNKECEIKFQKLNEAREILCDPVKRKNYDAWKNSGIAIGYKKWQEMKDNVHQSMHWANTKMGEKMLEGNGNSSEASLSVPTVGRRSSEGVNTFNVVSSDKFVWNRPTSSDTISKFRNYEI